MTQQAQRLITVEEFESLPESSGRFELIDGMLEEKPMPKRNHNRVSRLLMRAYDQFDPEEKVGMLEQETSVQIGPNYAPFPDLSYWIADRKPAIDVGVAPYPDLAVEIQSDNQPVSQLLAKARRYLEAGVRMVWIIQPTKQIAAVLRQGQTDYTTVQPTGELDGEDVIPGFKLAISKLFE